MRSEQILRHIRGPSVLDVGCTGHVVSLDSPDWLHGRLRQRFDDVAGIDISEEHLEELRAAGFDQLVQASAEDFDLGRCFDTIVAGELIEHLANPGCFLERAKAHLRPGGRIVLSTPYPFSLLYSFYALTKFPRTCQNDEHVMWFCVRTLTGLAERAGLAVTHRELIEDYDLGDPSRVYRSFVRTVRALRVALPDRLACNTMLFVLEPS